MTPDEQRVADEAALRIAIDEVLTRATALDLTHLLTESWASEADAAEVVSEERADAPKAAADDDADDDSDTSDEDDDDSGKGTEAEGRSDMELATEANGISDNGHVVDSAESLRAKLFALTEKRYDPYFFDSEDSGGE